MEEKKVTFEEKLTQLLELAKTKKNVLDNKEILNYFHGEILSPEQLDQIYDFLENHHVDVLRMDDDRLPGLRFRCRFPDGVSPVMHLERSSVIHAEAQKLLAEGLRKKLGERASGLRIELVNELSGWFDRPVRN